MHLPERRFAVIRNGIALLFGALLLTACTQIIAGYSLQAYTNATQLKAETLALVDASGEPYLQHLDDAIDVQTKLDAAYEFSAGTAYNKEATAMWAIIRDRSENGLTGSFFARWHQNSVTTAGYRKYKHRYIAIAFDRLICLEANKKEKTKCPALDAGSASEAEAGNE